MNLAELKYVAEHTGSRFAPILTHLLFYCEDVVDRCQAGNGRYVVDVPNCQNEDDETDPFPIMCISAERLVAAVAACGNDPLSAIVDEPGTTCTVQAGRVTSKIALSTPGEYPRADPDPETAHTAPGVAALLAQLQPFIATDASRPWATSVCVVNGFAYATNNVVLVRVPFPATFDRPVNIPGAVIEAVLAKGEPAGLGFSEKSLTFYFDDTVWIKTQLVEGEWPATTVDALVAQLSPANWEGVNESLGLMLETAAKLADDRHPVVEFKEGGLELVDGTFRADDLLPLPDTGKVNARMAALAFATATHVQWHSPRQDVHAFMCDDLVGVFGGQR